jgi:hypothetical protein
VSKDPFDSLLIFLNPDSDKAEKLYGEIRLKLIRFFETQSCSSCEELADETIQRVAIKISKGVEVSVVNSYAYFRGVALQEHF